MAAPYPSGYTCGPLPSHPNYVGYQLQVTELICASLSSSENQVCNKTDEIAIED